MGVDMALDNETSDSYAAVLYALSMSTGVKPEDITIATNDGDDTLCGVNVDSVSISKLHRFHRRADKLHMTSASKRRAKNLMTYEEWLMFQEEGYYDENLTIDRGNNETDKQRKLSIQRSLYRQRLLDDETTLSPISGEMDYQNDDPPFLVSPLSGDVSSPTPEPTQNTTAPTVEPTVEPTPDPTPDPSPDPTPSPTPDPTPGPTTASPSLNPTPNPTVAAGAPSANPTHHPISNPTMKPSALPTLSPVANPTTAPVIAPTPTSPVPNPAPAPAPQPAPNPSPPSNSALSFSVIGQQTTAEEVTEAEDALSNSISDAFGNGDFANILIDTAVQNNISSLASPEAIAAVSSARSVQSVVGEPVKINAPTSFPTSSLPTMNTPTAFPTGTFYPTATQPPTSMPTRSPYLYEEIMNDPILLSATISAVIFVMLLCGYIYHKRHVIRKVAIESLEDMELIERRKEIDAKLNVIKQKRQSKISRFLEIQQEHEKQLEEKSKQLKSGHGHVDNKIPHAQSKPKTKVVKVRDLAKAQGKEVFKSKPASKGKHRKMQIVPTIGENDSYNSAGEGENEFVKKFDPREMRRRSFANPNTSRSNASQGSVHPMEFAEETKEDILDETIDDHSTIKTGRSVESTNGDVIKRMMSTPPPLPSTPPPIPKIKVKNTAFLYLKPNANKPSVRMAVSKMLIEKGFKITEKGPVWSDAIISNSLFDKQYLNIAKRSMLQKPALMVLSSSAALKFKEKFGIYWHETISGGKIFNSVDAIEKLGVDFMTLSELWRKAYSGDRVLRLAKGFHVAYIINEDGDKDKGVYCVNGFYQSMRKSYLQPDSSIYYMLVEWDEGDSDDDADAVTWETLRSQIIGCSDPSRAHPSSIRKLIYQNWKKYGLTRPPDVEANGIHVSGSAFEATIEVANWLNRPVFDEALFQKFLEANVPHPTTREWMSNPQIKGKAIYDHFEGLGFTECVNKARELYAYVNKASRAVNLASRTVQSNILKGGNRSVSPTSSVSSASPSPVQQSPPSRSKPPSGPPPPSTSVLALGTPLSPSKASSEVKSLSFSDDDGDLREVSSKSPSKMEPQQIPPVEVSSSYKKYMDGISQFFTRKPRSTAPTIETSPKDMDASDSITVATASTPSRRPDKVIEPQEKPVAFMARLSNFFVDKKHSAGGDSLPSADDVGNALDDDASNCKDNASKKSTTNKSPLTAFGSPLSSLSKTEQTTSQALPSPNMDIQDKNTEATNALVAQSLVIDEASTSVTCSPSQFAEKSLPTIEKKDIIADADAVKNTGEEIRKPDLEEEKMQKSDDQSLDVDETRISDSPSPVLASQSPLTKREKESEIVIDSDTVEKDEAPSSSPQKMLTAAQLRAIREEKEAEEEKARKEKLAAEKERKRLAEEAEVRREKEAIAGRISLRERLAAAANITTDEVEEEEADAKRQEEREKQERSEEELRKKKASAAQEIMSGLQLGSDKKAIGGDGNAGDLGEAATTETELEKRIRMVKEAAMAKKLAEMSTYSPTVSDAAGAAIAQSSGDDYDVNSDTGLQLPLPRFIGTIDDDDDNSSVTSISTAITASSAVQYHGSVRVKKKIREKRIKNTTVIEL